MAKRIRRDKRYILVDDLDTANGIARYCMDHVLNINMDLEWSSVYIWDYMLGHAYAICLFCTLDEWTQVMNRYNLVKSKHYQHESDKLVWFAYELSPA